LESSGYVKIADFGLSKILSNDKSQANTFCGTLFYMAPELFLSQSYSRSVDWWAFGILLFELLQGLPPFIDKDMRKVKQKVLEKRVKFFKPVSEKAQDLILKLLEKDPKQRLGSKHGAEEVLSHPFFSEINMDLLLRMEIEPLYIPNAEKQSNSVLEKAVDNYCKEENKIFAAAATVQFRK